MLQCHPESHQHRFHLLRQGNRSAVLPEPYTDYDKATASRRLLLSVRLCQTDILAPGASETVNITVDKSELRTYDANNAKTYIVDAGDYYFTAATDAHNAVNNILLPRATPLRTPMAA